MEIQLHSAKSRPSDHRQATPRHYGALVSQRGHRRRCSIPAPRGMDERHHALAPGRRRRSRRHTSLLLHASIHPWPGWPGMDAG